MLYSLSDCLEDKIIGEYPQVNTNPIDDISPYFSRNREGIIDEATILPSYKLNFRAKQTDMLSTSFLDSGCLLISKKFLNLLQDFNLPAHQIFPVKLLHRKKIIDEYVLLSFVFKEEYLKYIIWDQSIFYKTKNFNQDLIEAFKVNNIEEMKVLSKEIENEGFGFLPKPKVVFPKEFDLFKYCFYPMPSDIFCQEKLKNEIENKSISGVDFNFRIIDTSAIIY